MRYVYRILGPSPVHELAGNVFLVDYEDWASKLIFKASPRRMSEGRGYCRLRGSGERGDRFFEHSWTSLLIASVETQTRWRRGRWPVSWLRRRSRKSA